MCEEAIGFLSRLIEAKEVSISEKQEEQFCFYSKGIFWKGHILKSFADFSTTSFLSVGKFKIRISNKDDLFRNVNIRFLVHYTQPFLWHKLDITNF